MVSRAPREVDTAKLQAMLQQCDFDIDQRTIQRDLRKLMKVFPLQCDEVHRPLGWSWRPDADSVSLPKMDLHAALAFHMAEEHLRNLLPDVTRAHLAPWFAQARSTLTAATRHNLANWPKKVRYVSAGQPLLPAQVAPDVLEAVQEALLAGKQLLVRNRRRGDREPLEFPAHPQALVYRDGAPLLLALLGDRPDVRQLNLPRMEAAQVVDEPALQAADFDLDAFIAARPFDFALDGGTIELKCLFDPRAAPCVLETPLAAGQNAETQADGRVLVTAKVPDTSQLRHWLRGFGSMVEVLAPAGLREHVV